MQQYLQRYLNEMRTFCFIFVYKIYLFSPRVRRRNELISLNKIKIAYKTNGEGICVQLVVKITTKTVCDYRVALPQQKQINYDKLLQLNLNKHARELNTYCSKTILRIGDTFISYGGKDPICTYILISFRE